jgi:16S rRNA (guanine527-N7)-methyltransferase
MMSSEFREELQQTLHHHGFPLEPVQLDQFVTYWRELKRWNSRMNLTSIRTDREIIIKHFLDSLSVLQCFDIKPGDSVIDIGTGAGFPGLPIKIYIPDIKLVLVEPSLKKVSFLRFLISQLSRNCQSNASSSWKNPRIVAQRAEECTTNSQHITAYDWVLTRYVASIEDSAAYCLPLLKPNGTWVAYKSPDVQHEIQQATPKLQSLGARDQSIVNSHIPKLNRTYVAIRQGVC